MEQKLNGSRACIGQYGEYEDGSRESERDLSLGSEMGRSGKHRKGISTMTKFPH